MKARKVKACLDLKIFGKYRSKAEITRPLLLANWPACRCMPYRSPLKMVQSDLVGLVF